MSLPDIVDALDVATDRSQEFADGIRANALEEAAQIIERRHFTTQLDFAAAIRALKDKPHE